MLKDKVKMILLKITVFLFCTAKCFDTPEEDNWLSRINCETTYDLKFVELLTEFITKESINGNGPIKLDKMDITLLTEACNGEEMCMNKKLISTEKYKKKIEALQCVNAVIVYYFLNEFKKVLIEKHQRKVKVPTVYLYAIKIVSRMLAVLYTSKTFAHNWLWTIYIRLVSSVNWPHAFITDNIFDFTKHMRDLLNYIQLCRENHYLPTSDISPAHTRNYYYAMLTQDIKSFIKLVYGDSLNVKKQYIFNWSHMFRIDKILLADYFHRDTDLLGSSKKGNIVWGPSKKLLNIEKDKLTAAYLTIEWVYNPFKFIEYHTRVLRILKVNTYYHVWSHLILFNLVLNQAVELSDSVFQWRVKDYNMLLHHHLGIVAKDLYSNDPVFSSVIYQLFHKKQSFDLKFVKILHSMTEALRTIIHEDLIVLGVDKNDILATFDVKHYNIPETYEDMTSLESEKNSTQLNINDNERYKEKELAKDIIAKNPVVLSTDITDSDNALNSDTDEILIEQHFLKNSIKRSIEDNMIKEHLDNIKAYYMNIHVKSHPPYLYNIMFFVNGNRELKDTFFPNI